MFINEVEHKVGLSKKSIRFYEENDLLNPKRNTNNDYRIYDEEDIHKLKVIKFLRELGVPIKELKELKDGKITLQECMQSRISKISLEEKNYEKVKNMCIEISNNKETYENIDINKYFIEMNTLNKEGFTMRNTKTKKSVKIRGAILSSVIFSLLFIFLITMISYFQFVEKEKMPWLMYILIMLILVSPIIGIIYNLIIRIREINGGEEDEASKY